MTSSPALSIPSIQQKLKTRTFGRTMLLFPEIDSTNEEALRRADSALPEGAAILAEGQMQGKGRLGRSWFTPAGVNLALSILLRPQESPPIGMISLLTALAAAEAIEALTGLLPRIKWPNDLLLPTPYGEKKTGGILLEGRSLLDAARVIVVGAGINVNLRTGQLPAKVAEGATSLFQILHKEVDRNDLTAELLNRLEAWYTRLLLGEQEAVRSAWMKRCSTLGRRVRAFRSREAITGVAEGITPEGALILRADTGSIESILAADIVHLRDAE